MGQILAGKFACVVGPRENRDLCCVRSVIGANPSTSRCYYHTTTTTVLPQQSVEILSREKEIGTGQRGPSGTRGLVQFSTWSKNSRHRQNQIEPCQAQDLDVSSLQPSTEITSRFSYFAFAFGAFAEIS